MSNSRSESHIAQQIRRDKLRIQEFPNDNSDHFSSHQGFNLDLLQVRNVRNANNMLHEPAAATVYSSSSSEMANFSSPFSAPRNNNTMEYEEHVAAAEPVKLMMHHQHGSFPYTSISFGNWRNSAATNQSVDWNIANYASSSMASESNQITFSASELNNNVSVYQHYGKPSYNEITDTQTFSLGREIQSQLGVNVMHHTQNALQDIVKSASIRARIGSESSQNICVGDGGSSELEQLQPTYANQQNHRSRFAIGNSCTSITPPPLGFKGKNDSNPQSLSLSLSSNSPSKPSVSHFEEGSAACASDHGISKDPEYVKSIVKPSMISRDCGKSLHNNTASYGNVGPLGPFTGYATILKSSRFLNSAQQLLDEFCCDVSKKVSGEVNASTSASADAVVTVNETRGVGALKGGNSGSSSSMLHSANVNSTDYQQKKAKLLYMQEEVARRYKQYHQQMQMVVSSFGSVAGLGSATPYVSLALKSVSRHFRCLKNTISDQLRLVCEVLGEDSSIPTASISSKFDAIVANPRCMDQSFQKNKAGRSTNTGSHEHQHHVWKPQRGLPEPAVAILKAWLFEHFLHPYPTDNDKHMLASQTGLSRNQVSNWFINARVRVWKPMVEEIHTLEMNGATGDDDNNNNNNSSTNVETSCNEVGSTSLQPRVDDNKPLSKFGMIHSIPENQFQCMEMSTSSIACCNDNSNDSEGKGLLNYEEQWSQEKRSKLEFLQVSNNNNSSSMDNGTLMGFVPYQQHGGLGSVSLTLGLRHGVEGGGLQNQQQLHEERFIRHFGGHVHDFVG